MSYSDGRTPRSEFAMRESAGLGQAVGKCKTATAAAMALRAACSGINVTGNTLPRPATRSVATDSASRARMPNSKENARTIYT